MVSRAGLVLLQPLADKTKIGLTDTTSATVGVGHQP